MQLLPVTSPVFGYIAGIGGLDITMELLEEIYWKTKETAISGKGKRVDGDLRGDSWNSI